MNRAPLRKNDCTQCNHNDPEHFVFRYLGHIPFWGYPVRTNLRIFRTGSMMAHAYILSSHGIRKLASRDYVTDVHLNDNCERGIDQYFFGSFKQYAIFPQLVVQSGSNSSNVQNGTHAISKCFQNEIIPWGIELHRDNTIVFEIITYFILPLLVIMFCAWAGQRRLRMIGVLIFLILIKFLF